MTRISISMPAKEKNDLKKEKKEQLISSAYYDKFEPATVKTGNVPRSSQKINSQ
jgi:hypothetical protein